jgi:acetyl esterase/lipase
MAHRRGRSLTALLTSVVVAAACSVASDTTTTDAATTTVTRVPTTTTTTLPPTTTSTTTTLPATTTTTSASTSTSEAELPDIGAEVGIPEGSGPFPAVVLVHGGGWIAGDPSIMRPLARSLNQEGFLTVNTPYQLSADQPGFPDAVDDVACAVRYAAAHPNSDGTVAVIGHSAGAHIAAIVALTGDRYALDCPISGSGVPEALVGLAGPYDVDRLGIVMLPFFGGGPTVEPEAWLAGNPQRLTDENTSLRSLVMYGEFDGIVNSSFAFDFSDALIQSGSSALLELVEDARHNDMRDPVFVSALIATWLER